MAMDRVEIDWSDTGLYDHPESDVTEYLREYVIHYGMRAAYDRDTFDNLAADGSVVLDNHVGLFNIESSAGLPVSVLTKRHLCRITSVYDDDGPDVLMWEGFVRVPRVERILGGQQAVFGVEGKLAAPYRDPITLSSDDTTRTVQWWLDAQEDAIGPVFVNSLNPHTGRVIWPIPANEIRGTRYLPTRHDFIEALSDFTGAFAFEDKGGELQFHDYQLMEAFPTTASLDVDTHRLDPRTTKLYRHYGIVRNAITVVAYDEGRKILEERIGLKESQAEYGDRENRCPPWYSPDTVDSAREWLYYRSGPIQYLEAGLYRNQNTIAAREDVDLLAPGRAFEARLLDVDGFSATGSFFCIGATLERRYDQPGSLILRSIATQLQEPQGFILGRSRLGRGRLGDGS